MYAVSHEVLLTPADQTLPPLEAMVAAFRERLRGGSPFVDEREAAIDLALEASPVLEALYEACRVGQGVASDAMAQAHEALAMMTLLGRRAAMAGLTPTAALAVVPAICEGLHVAGVDVAEAMLRTLTIVGMEGYAAGRDDVANTRLREALAECQRGMPLAPGVLLWVLAGPLDAALLGSLADDIGRTLLRQEAEACVLDVRGLLQADVNCAHQLASVVSSASTLGAGCMLVVDARWRPLLTECGVEKLGAQYFDDSAEAARVAFEHAGLSLKRSLWQRWFGRSSAH